ncbi:putative tolkin [Paratrimastix pyriformis]|uniref:Tolkin n=1 Tax=Paratrimastix pyriformis TaxID=342808 RepID=A0ABQ8UWM9_9EUKA|nr:putative tolkin [Paratrimastix pyriformis]
MGSYQNNEMCTWYIQPAGKAADAVISLYFESIDTEANYDLVTVYDGPSSDYPILGQASGETAGAWTTTSSTLMVVFTSDGSVTKSGWTLKYSVAQQTSAGLCSGTTTLTASTGTITDGSQDTPYVPNMDCSFVIAPAGIAAGQTVQLHFTRCSSTSHFVTVYDGPTSSSMVLARFSGDTLPADISGTGQAILVRWTSDGSENRDGFTATYSIVDATASQCAPSTTLTMAGDVPVSIQSGMTPYHDTTCNWRIAAPSSDYFMRISFSLCTLAPGDWVYIGFTTGTQSLGYYAEGQGTDIPGILLDLPAALMEIQFSGLSGQVALGFRAEVMAYPVSCALTTDTYTDPSMTFPSTPYGPSQHCTWTVAPSVGATEMLQIDIDGTGLTSTGAMLGIFDSSRNMVTLIQGGEYAMGTSVVCPDASCTVELMTDDQATTGTFAFSYTISPGCGSYTTCSACMGNTLCGWCPDTSGCASKSSTCDSGFLETCAHITGPNSTTGTNSVVGGRQLQVAWTSADGSIVSAVLMMMDTAGTVVDVVSLGYYSTSPQLMTMPDPAQTCRAYIQIGSGPTVFSSSAEFALVASAEEVTDWQLLSEPPAQIYWETWDVHWTIAVPSMLPAGFVVRLVAAASGVVLPPWHLAFNSTNVDMGIYPWMGQLKMQLVDLATDQVALSSSPFLSTYCLFYSPATPNHHLTEIIFPEIISISIFLLISLIKQLRNK